MKKFFAKFIQNLFRLQENFLKKKYNKTENMINRDENGMLKTGLSSGASLTLSCELEKNKKRVADEVKKIAEENNDNPENILNYAKERGCKFYLFKNAEKLLKPLGEECGLIFPKKGFEALYLNLITEKKIAFKTKSLFIFDEKDLSEYKVLYNFYKWYACVSKLPGFEAETLTKFRNIFDYESKNKQDTLNYNEIMALKQAIDRDREAMEFVIKYMRQKEGVKNAYDIMKNKDKGANI